MSSDDYWRSQIRNTYTFTGLSTETQYTIDIRVTDKAGLTTTTSRTVSTVSTDSLSKSEKMFSEHASNAKSSCTAPPDSGGCSGIYDMVYKSCMNN